MTQGKKIKKQERHLKVYARYVDTAASRLPMVLPEIRLCGQWLLDAGFKPGQTIRVCAEGSQLTIKVETTDESEP